MSGSVVIVGAGPTGLTLGNLLGAYGIEVDILEAGSELLDYPRAVGVDDESLRVFQTAGVVDAVLRHTGPNHAMRFLGANGKLIAEMAPTIGAYGWSRRNSFIQPLVDRELLAGLDRFPHVRVHFGHTFTALEQDDGGVRVHACEPEGEERVWEAAYVVGADGGRSPVRKAVGVTFEGKTESTRWLVVDILGDPLGFPHLYVGCDPSRPYVSIHLPHGIRRLELMLREGEDQETVDDPVQLRSLLDSLVPSTAELDIIRGRVYTHHARVANTFRSGRVLLAGDAAHLMPVWQGQGFNSGIRDAGNLGWKLAAVLRGQASDELLDTYDLERRPHATAMVKLSAFVGRIISPTRRSTAVFRDVVFRGLNVVPSVKRYLTEMRFKPMPRYERGVVAHDMTPPPKESPVGRMFPQPSVVLRDGSTKRLDEVVGDWFSVLVWSNPLEQVFDDRVRDLCRDLGAQVLEIRSTTQLHWHSPKENSSDGLIVGDVSDVLKSWFDMNKVGVAVLRPDRIVAGAAQTHRVADMLEAVARSAYASAGSEQNSALEGETR